MSTSEEAAPSLKEPTLRTDSPSPVSIGPSDSLAAAEHKFLEAKERLLSLIRSSMDTVASIADPNAVPANSSDATGYDKHVESYSSGKIDKNATVTIKSRPRRNSKTPTSSKKKIGVNSPRSTFTGVDVGNKDTTKSGLGGDSLLDNTNKSKTGQGRTGGSTKNGKGAPLPGDFDLRLGPAFTAELQRMREENAERFRARREIAAARLEQLSAAANKQHAQNVPGLKPPEPAQGAKYPQKDEKLEKKKAARREYPGRTDYFSNPAALNSSFGVDSADKDLPSWNSSTVIGPPKSTKKPPVKTDSSSGTSALTSKDSRLSNTYPNSGSATIAGYKPDTTAFALSSTTGQAGQTSPYNVYGAYVMGPDGQPMFVALPIPQGAVSPNANGGSGGHFAPSPAPQVKPKLTPYGRPKPVKKKGPRVIPNSVASQKFDYLEPDSTFGLGKYNSSASEVVTHDTIKLVSSETSAFSSTNESNNVVVHSSSSVVQSSEAAEHIPETIVQDPPSSSEVVVEEIPVDIPSATETPEIQENLIEERVIEQVNEDAEIAHEINARPEHTDEQMTSTNHTMSSLETTELTSPAVLSEPVTSTLTSNTSAASSDIIDNEIAVDAIE